MRQAVFDGPQRVSVVDTDPPSAGDGQVLVAVGACGICTWEQRVFKGLRPDYPLLAGHEIGGTVLEAPPGSSLTAGDVVAVSLVPRCNRCRHCKRGRDNLCAYASREERPVGRPWGPGGLAEVVAAPVDAVFALPGFGNCEQAALVEPLACVVHCLRRAGVRAGDLVAVFGMGVMGQLHVMCARALGCRTVGIVTDGRLPSRAGPGWPDLMIEDDPEDAGTIIRDVFLVPGADVAVCTRGGLGSALSALKLVQLGGWVMLFESVVGDRPLEMSFARFRSMEITVAAAVSHSREDFRMAAGLVASGAVDPSVLVGRQFSLDEIDVALRHASAYPGTRTMVRPGPAGPMAPSVA